MFSPLVSWRPARALRAPLTACAASLLIGCGAAVSERTALNISAGPVNQLDIAGFACGPAALLTSFRCGSEEWQKVAADIPGESDRSKMLYIIRAHGLRPSESLRGRQRWTRSGINPEDLSVIARELTGNSMLRPVSEALGRKRGESLEACLSRVHGLLRNSIKNGCPPILTLSRKVSRDGHWQSVQGHYVTVVEIPERLPRGATSLTLKCFDPWGGRQVTGTLMIPTEPVLPDASGKPTCLTAEIPGTPLNGTKAHGGRPSAVIPTMFIGVR